jgi:hypothetical protein
MKKILEVYVLCFLAVSMFAGDIGNLGVGPTLNSGGGIPEDSGF